MDVNHVFRYPFSLVVWGAHFLRAAGPPSVLNMMVIARAAGFSLCLLLGTVSPLVSGTQAWAQDAEEPATLLEAEVLRRDSQAGPIIAEGNVRAFFGAQILRADRVEFDQDKDIVTATGNVSVTDENGQTAFADSVVLSGDLHTGIATSFRALLAEDTRLAANYAVRRNGAVNELKRAVYSACDVCSDSGSPVTPTWRLKAFKVRQDSAKKVITYNNVFFEVKGVPLFYTPYFRMPDPSVERQSGFLAPVIRTGTDAGLSVGLPYYFALSDHYDATITPVYKSDDGVLMRTEWRQRTRRGSYALDGGFIRAALDDGSNVSEPNANRWHVFGIGDWDLTDRWTASFDLERTSDDTYLRRYDITKSQSVKRVENPFISNRLTSNINSTYNGESTFLSIDSYVFQGLRRTDVAGLTPIAFPSVDFIYTARDPLFGGRASVRSNLLLLERTRGLDTRRAYFEADWSRSHVTDTGHLFRVFSDFRADLRYYADIDQGADFALDPGVAERSDVIARAMPTVGVEWRYPLVKFSPHGRHTIEPRIQLAASPVGGNPDELINEDSRSVEFDTTSLFRENKFSGLDLWEDGQRANLGVAMSSEWNNGIRVSGELGQSFRLQESAFQEFTGLAGTTSDIVGAFGLNFGGVIGFNNRIRFDQGFGAVNRNEASLTANYWRFSGVSTYLFLRDAADPSEDARRREEFFTSARFGLTRNWGLTGQWRQDVGNARTIRNGFGIQYRDNCADFALSYVRDFTRQGDAGPNSSVLFTIKLRTLIDTS